MSNSIESISKLPQRVTHKKKFCRETLSLSVNLVREEIPSKTQADFKIPTCEATKWESLKNFFHPSPKGSEAFKNYVMRSGLEIYGNISEL